MTHNYIVKGMSCAGCIANIKKALESVPGVTKAEVQKEAPNAVITMDHHIDTAILQQAVKQYGNYQLSE
jgi:Cu2+-exporting ATPase/Cu+-exporting ATPase